MKKYITSKRLGIFIGIIVFILLWFILSLIIKEDTMILPSPFTTFIYTIELLSKSFVYECLIASLIKMLIGFIISFVFALIFGLIAGNNKMCKYIFTPTIMVFKAVPTAALVFLFMVLVGAKNAPILMVILVSFPILYESIVGGIENIDKNISDASLLDNISILRKIFSLDIPLMMPYLIVGIASSFSLSFKIEIMSEIIIGDTNVGIGSAIKMAINDNPSDMRPIFAYSLVALILIFIVSMILKLITDKIKKRIN